MLQEFSLTWLPASVDLLGLTDLLKTTFNSLVIPCRSARMWGDIRWGLDITCVDSLLSASLSMVTLVVLSVFGCFFTKTAWRTGERSPGAVCTSFSFAGFWELGFSKVEGCLGFIFCADFLNIDVGFFPVLKKAAPTTSLGLPLDFILLNVIGGIVVFNDWSVCASEGLFPLGLAVK